MTDPCSPCAAYRRGERENALRGERVLHGCERAERPSRAKLRAVGLHDVDLPFVIVGSEACPCGCEPREPGRLSCDKLMYGNAFLGPAGERIDPRTVTPVGE